MAFIWRARMKTILFMLLVSIVCETKAQMFGVVASQATTSLVKTLVVDQSDVTTARDYSTGGYTISQTFEVSTTGRLNSIEVYTLNYVDATAVLRIREGTGTLVSGYIQEIQVTANTGGVDDWVVWEFTTELILTAGTTYLFGIQTTTGGPTAAKVSDSNPYADGAYYYAIHPSWDAGTPTAGRDLTFRVYQDL